MRPKVARCGEAGSSFEVKPFFMIFQVQGVRLLFVFKARNKITFPLT